jgi:hypothetical protein
MKNKGLFLFWTDVANLFAFGAVLATGVILKWVVPHGGEGRGGGRGQGMSIAWLGMNRHEWGDVHFWIAATGIALLILHLAMHTGWIISATRKYLLGALAWPFHVRSKSTLRLPESASS